MGIPVGIFEDVSIQWVAYMCANIAERASQDIMPREGGLEKKDYGQCAIRSDGVI